MPYTLENDLNDLNDQIGLTFSEKRLKVAHIEPLLHKTHETQKTQEAYETQETHKTGDP